MHLLRKIWRNRAKPTYLLIIMHLNYMVINAQQRGFQRQCIHGRCISLCWKKGLFLSYKGVKYMDCLDNMKKSKMIRPNTTGGIMSWSEWKHKWGVVLGLLMGWVGADVCRLHCPCLDWGSDAGWGSIVEDIELSCSIDRLGWIHPGCDACPSTLRKAFYYGMIHLRHHSFSSELLLIKTFREVKNQCFNFTSILMDNFSPLITGTVLPKIRLSTSFAREDLGETKSNFIRNANMSNEQWAW